MTLEGTVDGAWLTLARSGVTVRATNVSTGGVRTHLLTEDTRYPFVINIPQHHLEPILRDELEASMKDELDARGISYQQVDDDHRQKQGEKEEKIGH